MASESDIKGHRQRLRDRFVRGEEGSRSDVALLELLLTYAIPQKDVKPLAASLLKQFGSLPAVLDSAVENLIQTDGIKENSAVLLNLVDWIRQYYGGKRVARKTIKAAFRRETWIS